MAPNSPPALEDLRGPSCLDSTHPDRPHSRNKGHCPFGNHSFLCRPSKDS